MITYPHADHKDDIGQGCGRFSIGHTSTNNERMPHKMNIVISMALAKSQKSPEDRMKHEGPRFSAKNSSMTNSNAPGVTEIVAILYEGYT
jgi:hypothetical protein